MEDCKSIRIATLHWNALLAESKRHRRSVTAELASILDERYGTMLQPEPIAGKALETLAEAQRKLEERRK